MVAVAPDRGRHWITAGGNWGGRGCGVGLHDPSPLAALGHRAGDVPAAPGTKIYDDNDELLTELHVERRIFVPLSQVPQTLRDAVIATEDRRFYYHWGIDPIGIARALVQNYRRGRLVEGAAPSPSS